jgi:toxin-antitoxin system PIN domain toxin
VIVPDINLLLYAHFECFPRHRQARAWWEEQLNGDRAVGLCAPVVFGFIRIATNRRVFDPPMSVAQAIDTVDGWIARPTVRWVTSGPRHLAIAFGLLCELGTAANLTTDAQIAAHAIENQGTVHSNDTDFGRFEGLRWSNPLG